MLLINIQTYMPVNVCLKVKESTCLCTYTCIMYIFKHVYVCVFFMCWHMCIYFYVYNTPIYAPCTYFVHGAYILHSCILLLIITSMCMNLCI